MKRLYQGAVLGAGALLVSPAFAVIDTTDIEAAISDASTAGNTVGAAVLVMMIGFSVWKWLRKPAS